MNITHLESFVTLSNALNYTRAAELLFITQPTLSRHIQAIESEVGCKLFFRNTHEVRLTPEGELFLKHATKIILDYKNGLSKLQGFGNTPSGSLHIGFLRGGTNSLIQDMLADFATQHPEVDIQLHDGNHNDLVHALKTGTHDITFTMSTTLAGDEDVETVCLTPLQTSLVVRSDHELAAMDSVSVGDFAAYPYICVHRYITKAWYDYVVSLYLSNGCYPLFSGTYDSITSLLLMVSIGKGITVLTDGCRPAAPDNLRLILVENVASPDMVMGYLQHNRNVMLDVFTQWFNKRQHITL